MKQILKTILTVALLAIAVSASAAPTPVGLVTGIFTNATFASSNSITLASSTPFIVRGATTTNVNSQVVRLYRGRGIAVFPFFAGTNAATTGNQTLLYDLTPDGVNFTTTTILSNVVAGNGLTGQRGYFQFFPDQCDNVYGIRLRSWQNGGDATNSVFVTNIVYEIIP